MKGIDNQEELVKIIKQIKEESFDQGYPTSDKISAYLMNFGKKGDKNNRYAWNTPSTVINYQGELIAVRPITSGTLFLNKNRKIAERLLRGKKRNIVDELEEDRVTRESKTYKRLTEKGYPTLNSKQHLIEDINELSDVLLTTPTPCGIHIIDALKSGKKEDKLKHLSDAFKLLHERHYTHNEPWADASLVNMAYDTNGKLHQYNNPFKPNPDLEPDQAKARDAIDLCISGIYRSNLPLKDAVKVMLDSYNGSKKVKEQILQDTKDVVKMKGFRKKVVNNIFNRTVYGMGQRKINKIKKEIHTYLKG